MIYLFFLYFSVIFLEHLGGLTEVMRNRLGSVASWSKGQRFVRAMLFMYKY